MSKWQKQGPGQVAIPSSADAFDLLDGAKSHRRAHSLSNSPLSASGAHQIPLTTAEKVLSRIQPAGLGTLDVSTAMARFGLDIGGTLCKVVYFEPTLEQVKEAEGHECPESTSVPGAPLKGDGFASGSLGRDGLARFAKLEEKVAWIDGLAESGGKAAERLAGEPQSSSTNRTSRDDAQEASGVHAFEDDGHNRRISGGFSDGQKCSCSVPGASGSEKIKTEKRLSKGTVGVDDDHKSKRQAQKLWVSSHEPVHLPGRGTLFFKCFETWRIEEFLLLTKMYNLIPGSQTIGATGGGARKFRDQFMDIAGLQLQRADELESVVRGIDFLVRHAHQESFEYPTGSYEGGSIQRPWESPENSGDESYDVNSSEDESSLSSSSSREKLSLEDSSGNAAAFMSERDEPDFHKRVQNAGSKVPKLKGPVLSRLNSGIWIGSNEPLHPYLVVNIGSGVSILRVDSPDKFERVGGTSLGGSTFLGLAKALTGCQSFEEAIDLASHGDSTQVDMLVGDIYGGDYTEMGLASTTVASSFGKEKFIHHAKIDPENLTAQSCNSVVASLGDDFLMLVRPRGNSDAQQPQHLAKAALLMVTNNIGSIACLHAGNTGVKAIIFTGSFLHNNKVAMRLLAVATGFWSKGNVKAAFLRHEGHAGAMGALLSILESSNPQHSFLSA